MTVTPAEHTAMSAAVALATRGPRGVNPQVGAVILSADGAVLAEGWHRGAGTPHAEVDALSKLTSAEAAGATAVVTLEPCNHTGRTGPCAEALIEAGIARVVYAVADPGALSSGGAKRLAEAGVDVEQLANPAATELIEDWAFVARHGRPHVTAKWAQSLDGRAAAADGSSKWITGPAARRDVHRRRSQADAIVVGTGTVLSDDPSLTARDGDELYKQQPVPVVIGTSAVPASAAIFSHPHSPIILNTNDLPAALASLTEHGIQRVFIEGGPTLTSAFIAADLVDEFLIYVAPVLIGGDKTAAGQLGVSTLSEAHHLVTEQILPLDPDLLIRARPRKGQSYVHRNR